LPDFRFFRQDDWTCHMSNQKAASQTPMMRQYDEIRASLPARTLLLFRLGDFYEMFHEDAEVGSRILGITLTRRHETPMAGIPYHAADNYIGKVLNAGWKVAIVDQVETPQPGKLVKRALTRILTAGTTLESQQMEAGSGHYMVALHANKKGFHAAWLELSTGEITITSEDTPEPLAAILHGIRPREVLLMETQAENPSAIFGEELAAFLSNQNTSTLLPDHFEPDSGFKTITSLLKVLHLEGYGIQRNHPALGAAGAVVDYATENLCAPPENLCGIRLFQSQQRLLIDPATLRNLEILRSARGTREGSLIDAIDYTLTAPGSRLLESWLIAPELDLPSIQQRQAQVGAFLNEPLLLEELREHMRTVRDLPRILGRLQNRLRNPRELGAIRETLARLPYLKAILSRWNNSHLNTLSQQLPTLDHLSTLLDSALNDELPAQVQDGQIFQAGYDKELDEFRELSRDSKSWLTRFEKQEQERTGIKNLRVKYNGAFGYFIEITKSNLAQVPNDYIRRQTLVNAERFTTDELKDKERGILHAEENALAREDALFQQLVEQVLEQSEALRTAASILAEIDVLSGWAELARSHNYVCPELNDSLDLYIVQGRHPVVENQLNRNPDGLAGTTEFVPNNTELQGDGAQIALITGPNMAGKSTYIRQVALITLLAHMGCWVPASECRLGWVDRIFSRVGASDDLARGHSTFMVEMNETANILNHATERSLVILDEIGRGTSTYDGLSIAWAVVEHLHGTGDKGPRTLFATHYHELTRLEKELPRMRNYSVAVKEWNEQILFLRQVIEGAADRSYGIQVARLAGLPRPVVERAIVLLQSLESGRFHEQTENPKPLSAAPTQVPRQQKTRTTTEGQLELF
jgi:DNA mismatch repair protein MutS